MDAYVTPCLHLKHLHVFDEKTITTAIANTAHSTSQRLAGRSSEHQVNPHIAVAPPPPNVHSPLRRDNVIQPPAITTSLSGLQFQASALSADYSATPASAVSGYNPFSSNSSPYISASPGGAIRGTSPMDARLSAGYNAPYNPQEWGPVSRSSPYTTNQMRALPRQQSEGERYSSLLGKGKTNYHIIFRTPRSSASSLFSPASPAGLWRRWIGDVARRYCVARNGSLCVQYTNQRRYYSIN